VFLELRTAPDAQLVEVRTLTKSATSPSEASVVREYVLGHPEETARLVDLIARGRQLWAELPAAEVIFRREQLFQAGLEQHADVLGDYEIEPGVRLLATTPERRLEMALTWSNEMQEGRLAYMGLEAAIPR
jgi:hypothetical protein